MEKNLDAKGRRRNRNEELLITTQMIAKIMKGMVNEYDG